MATEKETTKNVVDTAATKYSKAEVINALKTKYNLALMRILLQEDKQYTEEEAEKLIQNELKREVK